MATKDRERIRAVVVKFLVDAPKGSIYIAPGTRVPRLADHILGTSHVGITGTIKNSNERG